MSLAERLNLYNIVAILLPGVALLILVLPLLPTGFTVDPVTAALPVLTLGYLLGQAIHETATKLQSAYGVFGARSAHRELFRQHLAGNIDHPESGGAAAEGESPSEAHGDRDPLAAAFVARYNTLIAIPLEEAGADEERLQIPSDPSDIESWHDPQVTAAYTFVRTHIHRLSRGRSRVFQSAYAFCRSTVLLFGLGAGLYLGAVLETVLDNTFPWLDRVLYEAALTEMTEAPGLVAIIISLLLLVLMLVFRSATSSYKQYYVEYTLSDFALPEEPTQADATNITLSWPPREQDSESSETPADAQSDQSSSEADDDDAAT